MARTRKSGVDYFPLDTNLFMNRKVRLLRGSFGNDGVLVYINLLAKIYGGSGYYFLVTDEEISLFASDVSIEKDRIDEIIKCCIRVNLFSGEMYRRFSILTSCKVQEQYIEICKKRKSIPIVKDFAIYRVYNITDTSLPKIIEEPNPLIEELKVTQTGEIVTQMGLIVTRGTQRETETETERETERERETDNFLTLSESDYPVLVKHFEGVMQAPFYKGTEKDSERMAFKYSEHLRSKFGTNLPFRELDRLLAHATTYAMNER